jgi:hypothetical protein
VRYDVLTAADMNMVVFCVTALCSLLMMEKASISKTSVNFYQTIRRRNIPEYSHPQGFIWKICITVDSRFLLKKTRA